MSRMNRWVDELPAASPDRALLVAGRVARPPRTGQERVWRALALNLGTAATTTAVSAEGGAATAAQAGAGIDSQRVEAEGARAVVSAFGVGAVSKGIRSVFWGFVLGVGLLGVGDVADRVTHQSAASLPSAAAHRARANGFQYSRSAVPATRDDSTRQGAVSATVPATASSGAQSAEALPQRGVDAHESQPTHRVGAE